MQVPQSFKDLQRSVFQDKQITLRPAVEATGSLGSVSRRPGPAAGTAMVNLQLVSDQVFAQEWGLVVGQDAIATCSAPISVSWSDYVQHAGTVYKVVGVQQHDSHVKLVLKRTNEAAV